MTKFPLIATLLVATVAAPAMAEKISFTKDGVSYVYSQSKAGDSTVIRGHASNGRDFYYVVRKGQVVGKSDDMPVSFSVAEALQSQGESQLASAR